jgi:hypothetical protein
LPGTAESVEGLDSIGQPPALELAVLVGIVGDLADRDQLRRLPGLLDLFPTRAAT